MMKNHKTTKLALAAGAATLATLAPQVHAQSSDALIDKLVEKGILTVREAQDLRDDADKDFKTAFQAKTGMADWVTGYKITGDIRGRYEQFTTENPGNSLSNGGPLGTSGIDRIRLRYRLRFGITVNMEDNMEAGFRLGSGDPKSSNNSGGNPLSNNSSFSQNFNQKPVYIDTAYGKWTPINSGSWMLSAMIGKMDNPFKFTPMVFDPDITPEGVAAQGSYLINDKHSLAFTGGAFVLNDAYSATPSATFPGSSESPFIFGGQITWNAKWTDKWASSVGVGAFELVNNQRLTTYEVPTINQGNTRDQFGSLVYGYLPVIGDASVTYTLDTFPFYNGTFPITLAGEGMDNPAAHKANKGYWGGITFGKSGTKKTWDLVYRYEYLESDAWYDQLVDDDNIAYFTNLPKSSDGASTVPGSSVGYVSGTNIKGHYIRFDYSPTDSLVLSLTCYINSLIDSQNGNEPQSSAMHFMADAMWKF
jgi:hypothetical protein